MGRRGSLRWVGKGMEGWLLGTYVGIALLAVLVAVLVVLQTWEHHRFARSRLRQLGSHPSRGRALVIVPCRGLEVGLERNLESLFRQDFDDFALRFVVESAEDPVYGLIRRLMARYAHVASEVICAGRARYSGQKVHNLRVATADLPCTVDYLAFADSDTRLRRQWLRALVVHLDRDKVGAAMGYRWFIPQRPTLANHLLYSLNSSVAIFLGKRSPGVVWGGSWAIRRATFEALGIREAWAGTISDDLVAGRVIHDAGLDVAFEPACMVASPLDTTLAELVAFGRRQYLISRFYAPRWWSLILAAVTFTNAARWGSAALAVGLRGAEAPFGSRRRYAPWSIC